MLRHLKEYSIYYILCIVISAALTRNIFRAFYVPEKQATNLLLLLAFLSVITLIYYIVSFNKYTISFGIILTVIGLISFIIIMRVNNITSQAGFSMNEYLFYIISVVVSFLIFLLSRTGGGILVMFFTSIATYSLLALLQYEIYPQGLFVFLIGNGCLFLYNKYQKNIFSIPVITSMKILKSSFLYCMISLVLCIVASGMALSSYYFIVKPLNPPSIKTELVTKLSTLPIVEKTGLYKVKHLPNPSLSAKTTPSNTLAPTANMTKTEESLLFSNKDTTTSSTMTPISSSLDLNKNLDQKEDTPLVKTITYKQKQHPLLFAMIILLCLTSTLIGTKLASRHYWYRRLSSYDKTTQVKFFYHFFLAKFKLLGYEMKKSETPHEYRNRLQQELSIYNVNDISFDDLTDIFIKVNYGNVLVSDNALQKYMDYYRGFFKNCKRNIGLIKYSIKFFLL